MSKLIKSKEIIMFIILMLLMLIITFVNSVFIRPDNIIDLIKNSVVVGIMAMGMLLVVLSGGIDVSVGSSISAISFIVGYFTVNISDNLLVAFFIAAVFGIIIGGINALLITQLEISPIVATLGTMSIISGLLLYFTIGNRINILPKKVLDFSELSILTFNNAEAGIVKVPVQILFFLGVILLTWFILKYTVIGRGIYAIGGDPVSAERIGFRVNKIKLFVYSYMGFMTGIASVVGVTINRQVDPSAYMGYELQIIAIVILGGASVSGGIGSVWGTIVGVFLLAVIKNGLILTRTPTFWQDIIMGLVIILAIVIDAIQKNRHERNLIKVDIQ